LDSIIFVSQDSKDEFVEIFGSFSDMRVIYNPLFCNQILTKSNLILDKPFTNFDVFKFIAVGSLTPVKNYHFLIDCVYFLKKMNTKFKLFILGTGFLEDELKSKVNELNLVDYVVFLGFSDNPYNIIKSCDAFVMTSKSEALPTAMIEAMILGKPIITRNVTGCREVVNNGEYGLMSENSPEAFAYLMNKFITDEFIFDHFKSKALERSIEFSDEKFLDSFFKLLHVENSSN
jgi:glycosyltransferase involved in cell wall biosynthesis